MAVDVQGPTVVTPWTEKFGVTFPVAVDTADVLGAALGMKAIPVSYLVDEVGIIRAIGSGPSPELRARIEQVLAETPEAVRGNPRSIPSASSLEELRKLASRNPEDGQARLALAQALVRDGKLQEALSECAEAVALLPGDPMAHFTWGLVLLEQGQRQAALGHLRQARDLDPDNWRIRKQLWALENPERFYGEDGIDWDWQKRQIEAERRAGVGPP